MPPVLAVLIALTVPPAPSPEPSDCPVATGTVDWTGRYEAGEGNEGPPPMVMGYQADVFRDAEGRWRAFVWVSGQTTFREWRACGVESPRALELRGRARVPEEGAEDSVESILTIERPRRGALRFRIPGGSYLLEQPVLDATHKSLPPWAGVFTAETCPTKEACWRYRFEVGPADDGWRALVSTDGPDTTERLVARGEDGELVGGITELRLAFAQAGPGDARRGPPRKAEEQAGTLVRRKDGSTWVKLDGLPGPAGLRELPVTLQPKP